MEPRKKVEISLNKYSDFLQNQINDLESLLSNTELNELTRLTGEELLNTVHNFQNINLVSNSKNRMNNIVPNLLDSKDFSIWVNSHTIHLAKKISFYINSAQREID